MAKVREPEQFRDGHEDGLEPVRAIDINEINSFSEMLYAYRETSFGARRVGDALHVMEQMAKDPDCYVVCTMTGAMTVAKMGLVICEMIERGYIDMIISTGALQAHGMIEGSGLEHFKYRRDMNDKELFDKGYDRVYDTLELEKNLDDLEIIVREIFETVPENQPLASHDLFRIIGKDLARRFPGQRGILKSAYENKVPVIVPAFTDSELGLDLMVHNVMRKEQGRPPILFDPFQDLEFYAHTVENRERLGIFTIGGGVPRNWAQQIGPYLEIMHLRLGHEDGHTQRFRYGVRICPEPENWGGLSGCSYSEGMSWGKFVPESEGGQYAEVPVDATVVWPILVKALTEVVPKKDKNFEPTWVEDSP